MSRYENDRDDHDDDRYGRDNDRDDDHGPNGWSGDAKRFDIRNGAVVGVSELDDGGWRPDRIDWDESWSVTSQGVVKTELEHGYVQNTLYSDPDGDGVFHEAGRWSDTASAPTGPTLSTMPSSAPVVAADSLPERTDGPEQADGNEGAHNDDAVRTLFDDGWYLQNNADVAAAGVDALTHFRQDGWHEGRQPNAWFDTAGYLAANPDVAAAGLDPLEHYALHGWREGRDPSAQFDTDGYLEANDDVRAAGVNPLEHFLNHGRHEGREAIDDGFFL